MEEEKNAIDELTLGDIGRVHINESFAFNVKAAKETSIKNMPDQFHRLGIIVVHAGSSQRSVARNRRAH